MCVCFTEGPHMLLLVSIALCVAMRSQWALLDGINTSGFIFPLLEHPVHVSFSILSAPLHSYFCDYYY